jgi:hypothetical protein
VTISDIPLETDGEIARLILSGIRLRKASRRRGNSQLPQPRASTPKNLG